MTPLRQRMIDDMVLRAMSPRTQEAYLGAVFGLAKYYRRSPDSLSEAEVQAYVLYVIQERKLAWSSCNIIKSGLRFLYEVTLHRTPAELRIPSARQPQKLPQILSRDEVRRLLEAAATLKHRVLLMTTYAAGLRLSEVVHLKVRDIDGERMTLRVEQGKGAKDRYTLLSPRLLAELRRYWAAERPREWLFPGPSGLKPIGVKTAQRLYHRAKAGAQITKQGGIHALRHAFATHLLEGGEELPVIQKLMGHGNITTTQRYLHLAQKHLMGTTSPLELLALPEPRPRSKVARASR
jgi:integrase/recombinase XerD